MEGYHVATQTPDIVYRFATPEVEQDTIVSVMDRLLID